MGLWCEGDRAREPADVARVEVGTPATKQRLAATPRVTALVIPSQDAVVGDKIRYQLGGRLRMAVGGGAALSPDIARITVRLTEFPGYAKIPRVAVCAKPRTIE